ncbi:hypothetical protein B6N60_02686 [Richelia sinica FACHB-800]|uniref:Beta-lactamase hydrolase-family protein n=1 Tax=Richelia sinica FACHB-800 TaxID=1357546 RepID=A0A975Y595_9NOST|nr:sulfur transferase domain-containing protein [Richelia sinica]MBD2665907.1 hypothetical protein [Richelia sinica FACHB-800]QXE23984.1 hypothetical protein B6N60_02686 [Richelia sinica FACHB-800]
MDILMKINQDLAITGQIDSEQLQQILDKGYKSILNLRFGDEIGIWEHEQEKIELLGINYVNFPTKIEELNQQSALEVFNIINKLPKPVVIHCDNSLRSATLVLLYIATKQGIEFEQARQHGIKLGLI